MKIIYRYLTQELLIPFLFGVAAFTAIFIGTDLLFDLTDLYIEYGIGIISVIRMLILSLPSVIVFTFPMATLLATIMCYNRLAGDSEIVALRAGGVSIYRILIPALLLGLLMSFLTIGINEAVVPRANYIFNQMMHEIRRGEVRPRTQSDLFWTPIDSETGYPDYVLYAGHFNADTGIMSDVFFHDYYQDRPATLIKAQEARWVDASWYFHEGVIYHLEPGARVPEISFSRWEAGQITAEPDRISQMSKDTEDMNLGELAELIALKEEQGQDTAEQKVEWHMRLSIPFANFIFVLLAAPLGIKRRRSGGSAVGMGISIIVIFLYYILMSVGEALGTGGTIPPWLGAWMQNLVFFAAGSLMLIRVGR